MLTIILVVVSLIGWLLFLGRCYETLCYRNEVKKIKEEEAYRNEVTRRSHS